ncbi:hypothetical protein ABZ816_29425 [Actinosynnema sp. NPDC047251]|uniref:DUF4352 domain-containing protein n=1 Tax=Saccharothrix espanaensis (strain ATCC 51144 / DSM 44229 / JCM 9112 / NBRC 15066 / NRRL 15764) TaxID=1179773 RepID=K0JPD4_SACES|nr:hypothetical protein [Saccharothrix espanaensis]CCH28510.1 hypothetical protein BN6_11840 [Saccharothrix espanaensis DSM 44229]
MKFARLAVGLCLAGALAGCADHSALSESSVPETTSSTHDNPNNAPPAADSAAFGSRRVWSDGLSITVSPAKSLKPSDTSFPKAARTTAFVLTLVNGTGTTYRTSELTVRALVGGEPAAEVLDSVQGLNGLGAAVTEVPPGGETMLTLAFAVPENQVRMQLVIEPNGAGQDPSATFEGIA